MSKSMMICVLMSGLLMFAAGSAYAQPTSAVMQLGNQGTGTGFGGGGENNQSFHAADKMVPRTVVISAGGTVTFLLNNFVHGVGVYAAGTQPSDIDTGFSQVLVGCPPVPYLTDANGQLASFAPLCAGENQANQFQFNAPGRYLIICTFAPHFEAAAMWAWVIVQ